MTVTTNDRYKSSKLYYNVIRAGGNYRMTEFAAAFAVEQLIRYYDIGLKNRKTTVKLYREQLKESDIKVCFQNTNLSTSAPHIMPVVFKDEKERNKAITNLKDADIQFSLHYPSNNNFTEFSSNLMKCRKSENYEKLALSLPLYDGISNDEISFIIEKMGNLHDRIYYKSF